MSWTKTECAKFFGMSVAALDHWFLRGAPVERDHNGRISGCYVGDIVFKLWGTMGIRTHDGEKKAVYPTWEAIR